jgi:glycosyltransferase involved in cell wall biosynthesis
MRVLYITEGFPYPLTTGMVRHYHLIRGLSANHEIHLLSTVLRDFREEHVSALLPYCAHIETFRSTAGSTLWRKAFGRARDVVSRRGTSAAASALAASAERLTLETPYDAILLHGRINSAVLAHVDSRRVVTDLCDAFALRLETSMRFSSASRRAQIRMQLRKSRAGEARLIAGSSHLLFASARDRNATLDGLAVAPPSTVLPNGVDADFWHRTQPVLGQEVTFSGAMSYPPNDDAARFLVGEIMPVVWARSPDVRVRIVGRDPTNALRRAAGDDPRIVVTGLVDDVRPHLEHGAIYAAPLRFASGIQNKLLEAMAMELPVITSAVATDGLRRDDGVMPPVIVADSASAFAHAILGALERARANPEPDRAARAFVQARFTWAESVATLTRVLESTRVAA